MKKSSTKNANWESQCRELIAEVDTLRNRITLLEDATQLLLEQIGKLTAQKDAVYAERNRCVSCLAALSLRLGWDAWLGRHEDDLKLDKEWMTIVFINLPTGQVSWHIHESEVAWFSFLPILLERQWDGHTTVQKYERLAALAKCDISKNLVI